MPQSKYVGKIPAIKVTAERRSQTEAASTEEEKQQLRALIGSLQYACVNTRPDLSRKVNDLQSKIQTGAIDTLPLANRVLHEAKRHHDVTVTIQPIAMSDFKFLTFSDASFASKSRPDSHAGMMIVGTHQAIQEHIGAH